jgi:hypothetical protein
MITTLTRPAITHPAQQFQQITAHLGERHRDHRPSWRGHNGVNDRLNYDEAPGTRSVR